MPFRWQGWRRIIGGSRGYGAASCIFSATKPSRTGRLFFRKKIFYGYKNEFVYLFKQ
jgi:hypothetical protein